RVGFGRGLGLAGGWAWPGLCSRALCRELVTARFSVWRDCGGVLRLGVVAGLTMVAVLRVALGCLWLGGRGRWCWVGDGICDGRHQRRDGQWLRARDGWSVAADGFVRWLAGGVFVVQ